MDLLRSLQAIADAPEAGQESVRRAAKATTERGTVALSEEETQAYGRDLAAARERVVRATTLDVAPPDELVLLDRHQWIDAAIDRQRAVYGNDATEDAFAETLPGRIQAVVDAGRFSARWSTAAGHVVGRYDYSGVSAMAVEPDGSVDVVHPNVEQVSDRLGLEDARLRRLVVFTQVGYAATLGAVPWLPEHLQSNLRSRMEADGHPGSDVHWYHPFLLLAGYVDRVVSRMFDHDVAELRRTFHRNRWNRDLPTWAQHVLTAHPAGGSLRETVRTFFEAVEDDRGLTAVDVVWEDEQNLPTWTELGVVPPTQRGPLAGLPSDANDGVDDDPPRRWLERVDP